MQPLQCCVTLHVQRCCNEAVTYVLRTCSISLIKWSTCQFLLLLIAASKTLDLKGLECRWPLALEGGDCHVVTCSMSNLSVTSFIGFRSDINNYWLIRSLSESLCSLCILLFLVLLYFQHTNVSKASIRCHPSGNQLTTLQISCPRCWIKCLPDVHVVHPCRQIYPWANHERKPIHSADDELCVWSAIIITLWHVGQWYALAILLDTRTRRLV